MPRHHRGKPHRLDVRHLPDVAVVSTETRPPADSGPAPGGADQGGLISNSRKLRTRPCTPVIILTGDGEEDTTQAN